MSYIRLRRAVLFIKRCRLTGRTPANATAFLASTARVIHHRTAFWVLAQHAVPPRIQLGYLSLTLKQLRHEKDLFRVEATHISAG